MFFGARRKIDRADEHIRDVEAQVLALERDYVSSVEMDQQTGGNSIKYEFSCLQRRLIDIALITGDAVHNLRTALDHAWVAGIEALNVPPTKWTKFPFSDSAKKLHDTLSQRKIDTACPAPYKWITDIKPYEGGDRLLWALHDADITDKHKLVLPVIDYTSVRGISLEDEHGVIQTGNLVPRAVSQEVIFVDFAPNFKIKDEGKIFMSVFFHEGSALAGVPILETLQHLSSSVSNVIRSLERIV